MVRSARQTTYLALAVLAVTAACGKPAKDGAPWRVDAAQIQRRLQGTWTVQDGDGTARWQIAGDHAVVDVPRMPQVAGTLVIESPCSLAIRDDRGMRTTYFPFVFDGQTLHLGAGRAGVQEGQTIVACTPGRVYVQGPSGCAAYQHGANDSWVKRVATCAVYNTKDGYRFDGHTDTSFGLDTLDRHGLVFADDAMWAAVATHP